MIKICGITTAEDAEACGDLGATALGFNFYPGSPRFVSGDTGWIRGVKRAITVGVFVNETAEAIRRVMEEHELDVAQLHGRCEAPAGFDIWKAVSVAEGFSPAALAGADAYLLDAPAGDQHGGTGRTFDWSLATGAEPGIRIIVAGGLGPENVAGAVAAVRPWGIDACSKLESEPGRKDMARVRAFLEAAREAESKLMDL
ncbi:MAG: phosphoribosylanthranilate isomerase [Acidobacteria bacterium]|nr:phosphoribosylanthranilate isomerase [Acidobacteriota bacterium]